VKERSEGNLKEAILLFERAAETAGKNRALAAKALLEAGECYRKMGDAEARKIFERVIRDFADQKEAVAEARARMGGDSGAAGMVNRRVWSGPKVDTYGTVSPDGRSISHVNWSTGALAIYDIASSADRDLTPDTSGNEDNAEESVISKDGRMVAYSWFNHQTGHYELRLANLTGDPNPRRLYDIPDLDWIGPYDWSPDSKTIVAELKRQDRTAQIALISAADGSIRVLKSIDWSGTGRIFFSPDGRFIGYDLPTADNIRQHDVFVLSVDGSHETVAVRHPSLNFMMGWSPDGKWLLFASDRTGAMGLWAIAMADGKPQGAAELIRPDVGWPESLGITRSGALYYSLATLRGEGSHIQTAAMDFETGKLLVPATDVTHPHGESDSQPFWSHDGKLMAYLAVRGRLGSSNAQNNGAHMRDNALAIRAVDTGQLISERPLQFTPRIIGWTADDRAVLLWGADSKGKAGLLRLDIQSGEMTTVASAILDGPAANGPVSLDGPTAFYRRVLGEQEVVFMSRNIASGEEKEIARGTGLNPYSAAGYALGAVNLSPDGKWICTTGVDRASNSRVLLLIPAAGGMPRILMATPSAVPETELTNPRRGAILNFSAWGPGMQWVLAISRMVDSSQADELWRVPLDGGAPRKIEVEPGARIPFDAGRPLVPGTSAGPSLAPDGTHLAFTIVEATQSHTSEIWALENFLPRGGSK
jgi:Tol biopolymer transport system component